MKAAAATRRRARLACGLAAALACGAAQAQIFHLYLKCQGEVQIQGKSKAAHLDLALRDNNMTALIQRSNVLPVGERLRYEASPALYSMVAKAPMQGTVVYHDWIRGELFVWNPQLTKLQTVRLSIDRQTAELEGEMLDGKGDAMGLLRMRCQPQSNDDVPAPKF
ncbi:MAG: hypothetical protein QM750_32155 [Rubrivivax sp.]